MTETKSVEHLPLHLKRFLSPSGYSHNMYACTYACKYEYIPCYYNDIRSTALSLELPGDDPITSPFPLRYWKCNFPMNRLLDVRLVGWSVGMS